MTPRVLALLAVLAAPAAADVIVVDPLGGDGSALLQSALDAAQDGDLILVRPGTYGPSGLVNGAYQTPDRSITVVSDANGLSIRLFGLTIANLSVSRTILVRGFDVEHDLSFAGTVVQDCAGQVRLEHCSGIGHDGYTLPLGFGGFQSFEGQPGLAITHCPNVALLRCTYGGGVGEDGTGGLMDHATNGGPGVVVRDSRVAVFDCKLTGGQGGQDFVGFNFGNGGSALVVEDTGASGEIFVMGGTLHGGDGGSSAFSQAGFGGHGVHNKEPAVTLWLRGAALAGGGAGAGSPSGQPGMDYVSIGPVLSFTSPWGTVATEAPLRVAEPTALRITGEPGQAVFLVLAADSDLLPFASREGVLLVSPLGLTGPLAVGVIDGTGILTLPFALPALPPGNQSVTFPIELVVGSGTRATLGGATYVVGLGSGF